MALRISPPYLDAIRLHAERDYPNECCGVLLGRADSNRKEILQVEPLRNLRAAAGGGGDVLPLDEPGRESERNRFLIGPGDVLRVEKEARARGLDIVGYYHSHPDHPAQPSIYDREHAFPWYSYVIISVEAGRAGAYSSWTLSEDRTEFQSEAIEIPAQESPELAGRM